MSKKIIVPPRDDMPKQPGIPLPWQRALREHAAFSDMVKNLDIEWRPDGLKVYNISRPYGLPIVRIVEHVLSSRGYTVEAQHQYPGEVVVRVVDWERDVR